MDNRAQKVITKIEDPTAPAKRAPWFDADMLAREEAIRNNKSIHKVEKDLLDRLKVVYVDSKDPHPNPTQEENPSRPLPQDVTQHYAEFVPAQMRMERPGLSRKIPPGKVSLDQSVNILSKFKESDGKFGAADISEQYKLNKEVAANIVRHFEIFNMMETNTREFETDRPDPLYAGKGYCYGPGTTAQSDINGIFTGKDWVDKTKLVEVEAQRREALMDEITETKRMVKSRIEEAEQQKQLKE